MAWVMRNLIELKFWAKFVSEKRGKGDPVRQRIQCRLEGSFRAPNRIDAGRCRNHSASTTEFGWKARRREAIKGSGRVDLEDGLEAYTLQFSRD
jgi:hypothetical protein